jgi:hypothetical protein
MTGVKIRYYTNGHFYRLTAKICNLKDDISIAHPCGHCGPDFFED